MRLYSYIVAVDDGFAPCAMRGVCSLACCKPKIRKKAQRGDWMMGTTPKKRGAKRLVYLMQVEQALTFAEYSRDPKLRRRRDCIYFPKKNGGFRQKKNPWHKHSSMKKDLSGKHALVSRRFVYFGASAPELPVEFRKYVARGQGHRVWGTPGTKAPNDIRPEPLRALRRWAFSQGRGICGQPADRKACTHTACDD
jgi:hypothetical protein